MENQAQSNWDVYSRVNRQEEAKRRGQAQHKHEDKHAEDGRLELFAFGWWGSGHDG